MPSRRGPLIHHGRGVTDCGIDLASVRGYAIVDDMTMGTALGLQASGLVVSTRQEHLVTCAECMDACAIVADKVRRYYCSPAPPHRGEED